MSKTWKKALVSIAKNPSAKKDYTVKYDVFIWLDRNFLVEAYSQKEAEEKAEKLMQEIEEDMYEKVNPVSFDADWNKELKEWTFNHAKFDVSHVVED